MRQRTAGFRTSWTQGKAGAVATDRRRRVVIQEKQAAAAEAAAADPYSVANLRHYYESNSEIP